jgi:ribosomal protein S18 acetylase RimI-like enzyme
MKQIISHINISYNTDLVDKNILFNLDKNNDKYHWRLENFASINNIITANVANELVGFVIYNDFSDIEILRICVIKNYRKSGIAINLINKIKKLNKDIFLEVREDNIPAINLYQKCGFKQIGVRKNYYFDNTNAKIMGFAIVK